MNKFFHWVLVILLFETAVVAGRAEPSEQTMREASVTFLEAVIGDVLQNPETAKYFPGVKLKDDSISFEKGPEDRGWDYRWSYEHDVRYVDNPVRDAQFVKVPSFESDQGIVFEILVSFKEGGGHEPMAETYYTLLKQPRLGAVVNLDAAGDSPDLRKQVQAIIKSHLAAFQKAMAD